MTFELNKYNEGALQECLTTVKTLTPTPLRSHIRGLQHSEQLENYQQYLVMSAHVRFKIIITVC